METVSEEWIFVRSVETCRKVCWAISRLIAFQELVAKFNFHNFDNIRQSPKKSDPRQQKSEAKGLRVVSLLFSAAAGDIVALRRCLSWSAMEIFVTNSML